MTATNTHSSQVASGLAPYAGPWTRWEAAHLLRRATFGPTRAEIATATSQGLAATVAELLAPKALPAPPVNHFYTEDPNVPVGSTWIDQPYYDETGVYRWPSLRGWLLNSLQEPYMTVREKMLLFWNNHFGMADVGDHRVQYDYVNLFRTSATGNFRQLVKDVTIHPSMLKFLNGEYNNKWSPNENYARELLELFTIGKGPQVGPGDYTNYTEEDVAAMARILTGWQNVGFWSSDPDQLPESFFNPEAHDEGDKTLSYRFDSTVISNQGENEYAALVDLIFTKPEVARFISRKLYRYFVYYKIDDITESEMIEPMAQLLIDNNYEMAPVLSALFSSQHFYDMTVAGDVIKNPLEFMLSITRPLNWGGSNFDLFLEYESGSVLNWIISQLGLDFFYPPSVSGWPAWHLSPAYNRLWVNNTTVQRRADYTNGIGWGGIWVDGEGRPFDWLGFIATFDDPFNPNAVVSEFAELFLPQPLYPEQLTDLKNLLIPNLPDFEWTDEYGLHIANPDDTMLRNSVENKIKALARGLFRMAEFHLN